MMRYMILRGALGLLGVFSGAWVSGQSDELPGSDEIPMSSGDETKLSLSKRHDAFWLEKSAKRALEAGLYDLAHSLAIESLELLATDPAVKQSELIAIDALLAQERWIETMELLDAMEERVDAPESAIALRKAMVSFAEDDQQTVEALLLGIDLDRLSEGDVAWFWFLRGWAYEMVGSDASEEAYANAKRLGLERSPLLGAQIGFLIFRNQLKANAMGAESIPQLQNALLENERLEVRFALAQQLVVTLYDNGEVEQAISEIEKQLAALPVEMGQERAQFMLLQSMAAGIDRPEGRQAFQDLVLENKYPELMTIALQQAFARTRLDGSGKDLLIETLDRILSSETDEPLHALHDQALYYRAVFRFLDREFVAAEDDASSLLRRFPTSSYRRGVLALQASSAWNRNRYRTAASYLQRMRSEYPDLEKDSTLSALIADCYLRAGLQSKTIEDFRNAADAYATALNETSDPVSGGPLLFQLTYSQLRAGQLDVALEALDNPELRHLGGGEMVWRSEWMAIKEMRRVGRVLDAYDRVQNAIALAVSDNALKLRLLWLAVKLSFDSGQPEDTEYWVNETNTFIEQAGEHSFDPTMLNKVRASCILSLAESYFALEEPEFAVELLEKLREDYAGYESALFSYIAQARYFMSENRTVEAQQLLVSLADRYPENRLAPMALYEAALNAERRGQDTYLDEATKLLERIASNYPESDVVYYARLKQADLLRELNKFGSAERIYEFLENEYADRPDRFLAQMSLADTLIAQSVEAPEKFEAAVSRLELLMDLPEAPLGLRVEAGYKLGQAWRARGEVLRAKQIYWLLYDLTIVEEPRIRSLTRKGRYWLARTLFALAEIANEEGDLDKANEFYEQIVNYRLYGSDLAKARLKFIEPKRAN